jgi:hypothetical protein
MAPAGGGGGGLACSREKCFCMDVLSGSEQMAKRSKYSDCSGGNSGVGTVQLPLPVMEVEVLDL